jgi:hypothetical protein
MARTDPAYAGRRRASFVAQCGCGVELQFTERGCALDRTDGCKVGIEGGWGPESYLRETTTIPTRSVLRSRVMPGNTTDRTVNLSARPAIEPTSRWP